MRSTLPDLQCAFRLKHPTKRTYTYVGSGLSRIDRIYVSSSLAPYVERCNISMDTFSDHRPVFLHLRPAEPPAVGPGMRRTRVYFCRYEGLKAAFADWLEGQVEHAPRDNDSALLQWWPGFKQAMAIKAAALNKAARTARLSASAACASAKAAFQTAMEAAESDPSPATLAAATSARRAYVSALLQDAELPAREARQEWLHTGERPCPLLTKLTRPPQASRLIPCLRAPSGGLVVGNQVPRFVAHFYEHLFAAQPRSLGAQTRVLDALRKCDIRIQDEDASRIGTQSITLDECTAALKRSASGRSPGPDGLPTELYRTFQDILLPVLADVMSAIGRSGATPAGFLDGVLITLFKKGDNADIANYRPITLLNTDYRLLAKVLAARLGPVLGSVIGPEQSAFLPGRNIGDNIMFMQLLPDLLRAEQRSAVVAFLDFVKAYDTVDRGFLFQVMEAMGVGRGFLGWVKTLLTNTQFIAMVNGFASPPVVSQSGVRQGCPLSPLLYLFVAQALQCWLRDRNIGITIAGIMCAALQYADDTAALLPSATPACVQNFLDQMLVFGEASGQHLNLSKCELLPVGIPTTADPAPGSLVKGLKVVSEANVLSMRVSNDPSITAGPAAVDWDGRVAGAMGPYTKLARLHLSVFGRAFGASGYGVSKLLYHAEFGGLPASVADRLLAATKCLVDRGRAPGDRKPALPGVPSELLPGHPSLGGFGCLAWPEHIRSRHAVWGARLMVALAAGLTPESPLWHHAALALLARSCGALPSKPRVPPVIHPALALISAKDSAPGTLLVAAGAPAVPRGPLHRMILGLRALNPAKPRPVDVTAEDMPAPGPWCLAMPLWGNPLLPCPPDPDKGLVGGPGTVLDDAFWDLQVVPSLRVVFDAVRISRAMTDAVLHCRTHGLFGDMAQAQCKRRVWDPELQRCGLPFMSSELTHCVQDRHAVLSRLQALCAALPPAWVALYDAHSAAEPTVSAAAADALQLVVRRLGWRLPPGPAAKAAAVGAPVMLPKLVVKTGTLLQLGPSMAKRLDAHTEYARLALELPPGIAPSPAVVTTFAQQLSRAWRFKWENVEKEVLWRLAVDGVAGANHRGPAFRCCGCPEAAPDDARQHFFWDCPVAGAVRATIADGLAGLSDPPAVSCASLWLCQPVQHVDHEVWLVVCMAALSAMDHGRRQLWRLSKAADRAHAASEAAARAAAARRHQRTLLQLPGVVRRANPAPLVARASALAVADFWGRLASFVALGKAPDDWLKAVGSDHPFICNGGFGVNMGAAGPLHMGRVTRGHEGVGVPGESGLHAGGSPSSGGLAPEGGTASRGEVSLPVARPAPPVPHVCTQVPSTAGPAGPPGRRYRQSTLAALWGAGLRAAPVAPAAAAASAAPPCP